jgi:hypothetical protein
MLSVPKANGHEGRIPVYLGDLMAFFFGKWNWMLNLLEEQDE